MSFMAGFLNLGVIDILGQIIIIIIFVGVAVCIVGFLITSVTSTCRVPVFLSPTSLWASLVAQIVKNPPAVQETQV